VAAEEVTTMAQPAVAWNAAPDSAPDAPSCKKCSALDSTLRASAFDYVLSALYITLRRVGSSGVFCASCRRNQAIKWSLLTALVGWWGIPWGPVFSIQALVRNARGGRQDKKLNAALLREAGQALASRGDTVEAIKALEQSAALDADPTAERLLHELRGY
jgi:hypothetical protein